MRRHPPLVKKGDTRSRRNFPRPPVEDLLNRFAVALFALCSTAAIGQTPDPGAAVVTINGDVIKAAEYYRRMEYLPGITRRVGNAALNYPPGFLTLEALITERLVFQLARQKGVMPTEPEIQAEYASMLAENPKLLTEAALVGQTKADIDYQIKYNLAQFKLATFGITITDQEIDAFYRSNPDVFTIPKRFKLSVIAVTDEGSKSKIDAELAAKTPFADVAKKYSEDVTRAAGGDFGTVPLAGLPEGARNAISTTKIGETTAWVAIPKSTVQMKFLLHDVEAEEKIPLDAKQRKQIRRQLMLQKGTMKNDVGKELAELRAKSKIDITNKVFADIYKKFMEEFLQKSGGTAAKPPAA
jgi:parvulin-like peptidyl-prolyl isomerase